MTLSFFQEKFSSKVLLSRKSPTTGTGILMVLKCGLFKPVVNIFRQEKHLFSNKKKERGKKGSKTHNCAREASAIILFFSL